MRDEFTIFSGLLSPERAGQAHVCADTWLTGASIDAQGARQYHNTVSCDQLMAEVTSPHTRFASLELSISSGTGQPNNSTTLAFSRDGVPLPAEDNPRNVFDRLFGAGARRALRAVVATWAGAGACSMRCSTTPGPSAVDLGADDRSKLDEYLHSVRDVEQSAPLRLDAWLDRPKPKVDGAPFQRNVSKEQAGDYYRTMFDLIVLALRTDMTRVVTYMNGSRGQRPGHPRDRHHPVASPALAPRRRPRDARPAGQERRLPDAAVRLLPRQAPGYRPTAASRSWTARWSSSAAG